MHLALWEILAVVENCKETSENNNFLLLFFFNTGGIKHKIKLIRQKYYFQGKDMQQYFLVKEMGNGYTHMQNKTETIPNIFWRFNVCLDLGVSTLENKW